MKVKGERDQECGPTNPCWCGKETWHVMQTAVGVNCWMISLEYLSLCVSHAHIWRWWVRRCRAGPVPVLQMDAVGSFCCLSSVIGKEHTFCTGWVRGNFMDSHHSHSHHPLWIFRYWGALSVMWVAEHLHRTDWTHPLSRFLGEFTAFLLSSPLKCKPTLFPGPQGQHVEWNPFLTICHLASSLISPHLSFLKCLMGTSPFAPPSHFLPCPPSFSDQLFLCCLKTIRKESEMDPGDSEVILIFRYAVASSMDLIP